MVSLEGRVIGAFDESERVLGNGHTLLNVALFLGEEDYLKQISQKRYNAILQRPDGHGRFHLESAQIECPKSEKYYAWIALAVFLKQESPAASLYFVDG